MQGRPLLNPSTVCDGIAVSYVIKRCFHLLIWRSCMEQGQQSVIVGGSLGAGAGVMAGGAAQRWGSLSAHSDRQLPCCTAVIISP